MNDDSKTKIQLTLLMACTITAGIAACETTSFSTATITSLVVTTFETTITTTQQIVSTFKATSGETLTFNPPPPPWLIDPSTTEASTSVIATSSPTLTTASSADTSIYTTSTIATTKTVPASTVTITEALIVILGTDGNVYTTSTVTLPAATTTYNSLVSSTPVIIVVGHREESGWNAWSDGERGGLIAGCAVVFLIAVSLLLYWCMKRRQIWVSHEWSVNSHPGFIPGHSTYGRGYGYPYPSIRGGGGGGGGGGNQPHTESTTTREPFRYNEVVNRGEAGCEKTHTVSKAQKQARAAFYRPPVSGNDLELASFIQEAQPK